MKALLGKISWRWLAAPLWLIAGLQSLSAIEQEFAAQNFAITPPAGWGVMPLPPQPGLLASFGKPDRMSIFYVVLEAKSKPSARMDDSFIAEFDKGVTETSGDRKILGRFLEVAGIKRYERLGHVTIKGRDVSTLGHVILAGGKCYCVQGMRFDGDASADPEIRQALTSFRFLKAPTLSAADENSDAYRAGRVAGRWLFFANLAVVGIAVLRRLC